MSEARLLYNHVVDSLPNKHDRDTIRTYVDELEQQNKQMIEALINTTMKTFEELDMEFKEAFDIVAKQLYEVWRHSNEEL